MVIGFSFMLLAGILVGNFTRVLSLAAFVYPAIWLLWTASRRGTFIVINLNKKTLQGSNFFIKTTPIPIETITHIGTRGMFGGAATEVEITYTTPNGQKMTIGYGARNVLNPPELQKILKALVTINPALQIPSELQETHEHS
jgi:hypothetical protein